MTKMKLVTPDEYRSGSGMTLRREFGRTPGGNDLGGRWVLRSAKGKMLGFGAYRNDLADEFGLTLEGNPRLTAQPRRG